MQIVPKKLPFGPLSLNPVKWLPIGVFKFVFSQWRLITSALIAGAIIHILVTLSAAQIRESQSFRMLTRGLPTNKIVFATAVTDKAQPLPFFDPDSLYSYCRYDASAARIRVSAKLPESGWSLSLHSPKGENFYFVSGSDERSTDVELVLVPPGNVFTHGPVEASEASQSVPQVKLPDVNGLVILRAPIKGFAYRREIDELRSTFACGVQTEATDKRR